MQRAHDDLLDPNGELDGDAGVDQLEPATPRHIAPRTVDVVALRARVEIASGQAARRLPYAATAAAAAAGYGSWGLIEATAGTPAAGTIALCACAATAATLPVLRIRYRDRVTAEGRRILRIPVDYRRRWWQAGGFFALWVDAMSLGATSIIGPDGMAAVLLGGAAALSARWMRRHPVLELPTDTPPPVLTVAAPPLELAAPEPPRFPTRPPPDEGDLIKREWNIEIAGTVRPDDGHEVSLLAPGAVLGDDREDLPHAYRWFIQLPRSGDVTIDQLCDQRDQIAFKLGRSKVNVIIKALHGPGERGDRGTLTVVVRNVLEGGVDYPGPRYLPDGRIPIGELGDGTGPTYWRCKDEKGALGGLVVGSSGAGKSDLLARIGMAMRYGEELIVVVGDGDEDGRSNPLLKRIAYHFAAGAKQVMQQLKAFEAWFHVRGKVTMGKHTTGPDGLPVPIVNPTEQETTAKLMPCQKLPGWIWIIDEFFLLAEALGQDFVKRVSKLRRAMRKRGGNIIVGTQSPGIGDFGGDDVLQGQLMQDNVAALRTKNDMDQYALPADFGCDPTTLPDGGGYGFVNDPEGDKVMFRGEYDSTENMALWVHSLPEYRPDLPSAAVFAYKCPAAPLDPVASYDEAVRTEADIFDRIAKKLPLPWEEQPEADELPAGTVGGDGAVTPGNTAQQDEWIAGVAKPVLIGIDDTPAAGQPAREWGPLTQPEQLVLAELAAAKGPLRNQPIREATGLSGEAVSKAFSRNDGRDGLLARGYATKHAQGLHEVTDTGRTWVQAQPAGV
jgi:hypothetical protein